MADNPTVEDKQIRVVIAGRPYPLRVAEREEESLRGLVQEINEKFNDFQIQYATHDKQDCLVLTLLTYASELHNARQLADTSGDGALSQRLRQLNALVDGML